MGVSNSRAEEVADAIAVLLLNVCAKARLVFFKCFAIANTSTVGGNVNQQDKQTNMDKEIIELNDKLTFFTEFDLDLAYPVDKSKRGAYSGYWVGKQKYFKSPEIEIILTTTKQTKDLLNWDIIEKTIAEIAKQEEEIYSLSEKVMIEFFKTSNLLNYNDFKICNGVFVPTFLTLDYDNQYYSEHQLIREFEFAFEPDFWDDNSVQGDFDLVVRLHRYKDLFVNGVSWHLRPYAYIRPQNFENKHKPKSIIDKLLKR